MVQKKGSRHDAEKEYQANLVRRGKLDKIWIYCPNKLCKHHLSFKRSTGCLLLKCPVCMKCFNPFSPTIIQCKKCKTKNSTFLWNQIIQCANKDCKTIINCWPVFKIERYKDFPQQQIQSDVINLDPDNDDDDVIVIEKKKRKRSDKEENDDDDEDDVKVVEKNMVKSELSQQKEDTFLIVEESEIGAYSNRKKKNKFKNSEKIIRMENDNGLVVIINDDEKFKAKQNIISEPKTYKSPFEHYFTINLDIWQDKYPDDNKMKLLIKMKKYWNESESVENKDIYIKLSKDDRERYEKEIIEWRSIEWMNDKPYLQQDDEEEDDPEEDELILPTNT